MALKQEIGSIVLIPGAGGVFDVSIDGERIYSKLETGKFPDPAALVKQIKSTLG